MNILKNVAALVSRAVSEAAPTEPVELTEDEKAQLDQQARAAADYRHRQVRLRDYTARAMDLKRQLSRLPVKEGLLRKELALVEAVCKSLVAEGVKPRPHPRAGGGDEQ